jgi:hypothetical protein
VAAIAGANGDMPEGEHPEAEHPEAEPAVAEHSEEVPEATADEDEPEATDDDDGSDDGATGEWTYTPMSEWGSLDARDE